MTPHFLMIEARNHPPQLRPALEALYRVDLLPDMPVADRPAFAGPFADTVSVLVTQTLPGCDAALMAALPRLGLIACSGAHVDNIDLDAARARGIAVGRTPSVSMGCVADFIMGQIVNVFRRLAEGDRMIRAGRWPDGPLAPGRRVYGRRLGIVGLGRIGRLLARRASGFDMPVAYFGPRRKADVAFEYYDDLPALARDVDVLAVTCVSGPQTRDLIDGKVLQALGPEGVLVNVSRGVLDEDAVLEALVSHGLGGAALDVHATAPHVREVLLTRDDVVLSPHMASNSLETTQTQTDAVLACIEAHLTGQPLPFTAAGDH